MRQFVADASHELRTPLAAIRGYTELTQRMGDDREAVAHAMSRVASETERITRLVEDLLLLARLDSGRPLEREPVDLSRLAVDAVSDAHVAGPDHQWELDLPEEPVIVTGDAARLHQVVTNLLANARIHTGAGTVVTTRLTTEPTTVRAAGDRQRPRHSGSASVGGVRAVRPRRYLALPQRGQHRAGPGDRLRGSQGAQRDHHGQQLTRPHRIHGAVATQRVATARRHCRMQAS